MKKALILILSIFLHKFLFAQISPGDLATPHANLEGIKKCTKCHTLGGGPDTDKCLECHQEIKFFLDNKSGFHFNTLTKNKECFECHNEHNGRNFQLIYWPNGRNNFNHNQAGYILKGKHAQVKCEYCHTPKNIKIDLKKLNKDLDLNKTYLGLKQTCLSCHVDEHQGQLSKDCITCHDYNGWKLAPKFNHAQAKFKLTGKHVQVTCNKCHFEIRRLNPMPDAKPTFTQFTGLKFQTCNDCHKDIHKGKFGTNCQKCHDTSSWRSVNKHSFNHSLTRFPLLGKHRNVDCVKCHVGNKFNVPLQFAFCKDCHRDIHQGQFATRLDNGRCENCHDVNGFSPAKFGFADHSKTDYPLTGAHLAVPCRTCHVFDSRGKQVFKFKNKSCSGCHKDIHQGQFVAYLAKSGCETCHKTESWQETKFDHQQTKFPLKGKHIAVSCNKCHPKVNKGQPGEFVLYKLKSTKCGDCHKDIHLGQFKRQSDVVDCSKCHTASSWFALIFDHNVQSSFKITGAHKNVKCGLCHKRETRSGIIRFKPIDHKCNSCHGNKKME